MNSYSQISRTPTHPHVQRTESSSYACSRLLTALAIITLIGSLIVAGVLYKHTGSIAISVSIGSVGTLLGGALLLISSVAKKTNSYNFQVDGQNMNIINKSSNVIPNINLTRNAPFDLNSKKISNLQERTPQPSDDQNQEESIKENRKIIEVTDDLERSSDTNKTITVYNSISSESSSSSDEIIDITNDSGAIPPVAESKSQKTYALSKTALFSEDYLIDYSILLSSKYFEQISIPSQSKVPSYYKDLSCLENLQQRTLTHMASNPVNTVTPFFLNISKEHWALILVDQNERTIDYYDSLQNYGNHGKIISKLEETAKKLSEQDSTQTSYRFILKIKTPIQNDGYQCGAWSLYFLEKKLEDPAFDPNSLQLLTAKERSKIIAEYRSNVINQLNEMDASLKVAENEEKSRYDNHKKYREDKAKFSIVELWQNRLNGKLLTPTS